MWTLDTHTGNVPFNSHAGSHGKGEETEVEGFSPQSHWATAEDWNKLACQRIYDKDFERQEQGAVSETMRESFFKQTNEG